MKTSTKIFFLVAISLVSQFVLGQANKNDPPPSTGTSIYEDPQWIRQNEAAKKRFDELYGGKGPDGMIKQPQPIIEKKVPLLTKEEKEELEKRREEVNGIQRQLLPSPIYFFTYQDFLKDEKVGLMRLFVDKNCDEGKVVTTQELERCADVIPIKGGGSYYSFRTKTNYGYSRDWWDIHFTDNKLKVGSETVQGIISEIRNVKWEDVDLKSPALEFLLKYKPKNKKNEFLEQRIELEKGINSNGFIYSNSASIKFSHTYILRSVPYSLKSESLLGKRFSGMDVIVSFKIVGQEGDGSLVILWKELKIDNFPRVLK